MKIEMKIKGININSGIKNCFNNIILHYSRYFMNKLIATLQKNFWKISWSFSFKNICVVDLSTQI